MKELSNEKETSWQDGSFSVGMKVLSCKETAYTSVKAALQ